MQTKSFLLQRKGELVHQMQELTNKVNSEKRNFSPDEDEKFDKIEADLNTVVGSIEKMERASKFNTSDEPEVEARAASAQEDPEKAYEKAYRGYLLRGERISQGERDILEKRGTSTQVVGTGNLGGYLAPTQFSNQVVENMVAFGGVLDLIRFNNTDSGVTLTFPTEDTTSQEGAIIAENAADTVADVTWGQISVGAYMYTSNIVKLSWELLNDNIVNAEARLKKIMATRLARILSRHLTVGTGSSQPQGFVVGGTVGVTTASATAITYDEIINLLHSLDPAWRKGARLAFNDTTLKAIRKMKNSQNDPLWIPSMREGVPDTIHGIPYTIVTHMADYGTTANKFMAYGNFDEAYFARKVQGDQLTVFKEKYADQRVNGYMMNSRFDGKVFKATAIQIAQHA